jgi:hypothetical protein
VEGSDYSLEHSNVDGSHPNSTCPKPGSQSSAPTTVFSSFSYVGNQMALTRAQSPGGHLSFLLYSLPLSIPKGFYFLKKLHLYFLLPPSVQGTVFSSLTDHSSLHTDLSCLHSDLLA